MKERTLIFTDGAAKGNPGRGGFGVVISHNGTVTEIGGFKEYTTNNEMELKAVVEALKAIKTKNVPVEIYTDSKYVVEGAKGWVFSWAKNGWKTMAKTDVLNKELWQELLPLLGTVQIEWHKVPGHVGIVGNERADVIASTFAEKGTTELYAGPQANYGHDIHNTSYDETKAQDRSDARKRQAQKAYSYVSVVDGEVLIHKTWSECEARVKGKKGARFKKSLDAQNEKDIVKEFGGVVVVFVKVNYASNMKWDDNLEVGTPVYNLASSKAHTIRSVAGPGAGKSFAIQRRITRLMAEGVDPEKILAVTFTRTAAHDLKKDISSLEVEGSEKVAARTLHSHALGILMRADVIEKTGRTPRMILEHELKSGLYDLSAEVYGDLRTKEKLTDAYLAAWAKLQIDEPGFVTEELQKNFENELTDWMKRHSGMLVGEVIPEVIKYLKNNPACEAIGAYDVILVDEYQDLNKAEQELIRLIRGDARVVIVGDDDQSIYGFKFAHPEGIQTIEALHGEYEDIPFAECRRCPQTVTKMASSLISNNPNRTLGELIPRTENPQGEVNIIQWKNFEEEIPGLVQIIKQEIDSKQIQPKDILILSPRRRIGYKFRDKLLAEGIAVKSYFRESAIKKIHVQRAYSLMNLLANPNDQISLRFLLGAGGGSARAPQYQRLVEAAQNHGLGIRALLDSMVKGEIEVRLTLTILSEYRKITEQLIVMKAALVESPEEFITHMFVGKDEEREFDFYELNQIFMDAVHAEGTEAVLIEELRDGWFRKIFARVQEQVTNPEIPEDIDHARIMSLHSSKGLSSKLVIVCSMIDELMPFIDKDVTDEEETLQIEEQRRLFYVAITRCKGDEKYPEEGTYPGRLIISSFLNMPGIDAIRLRIPAKNGITRRVSASQFILELGKDAPAPILGPSLLKKD